MAKPRASARVRAGACGATLASGLRCQQPAKPETGRCGRHKPAGDRVPDGPGWFIKKLSGDGRAAIDRLVADPQLLDVKVPVALHALSMSELPFNQDAKTVELLAQEEAAQRLGVGIDGVAEQVRDIDRHRARVRLYKLASRAAIDHGEMVGFARKALDAEEVMRGEMLPIMLDFAKLMASAAKRYIPAELHARFEADVAAAIAATVGRMQAAKHELVDAAHKVKP